MTYVESPEPALDGVQAEIARQNAIYERLKEILSPKTAGRPNTAMQMLYTEKAMQKGRELADRLGLEECRKYRLYHLLIGSGIDEGKFLEKFDLPGDEIQKFIESLSQPAPKAFRAAA